MVDKDGGEKKIVKKEETQTKKSVYGDKKVEGSERAAVEEAQESASTELRPDQIRDTISNHQWMVVGSKYCTYTEAAINLLQEHGETKVSVGYIEDDRRAFQNLITKDVFYTPAIFIGGNLLGSYGELESYYKRTFFVNDYNKINK